VLIQRDFGFMASYRNSTRSSEGRKTSWETWACGKREFPTNLWISNHLAKCQTDSWSCSQRPKDAGQRPTIGHARRYWTFVCESKVFFCVFLLVLVTRCRDCCYRYQIILVTVMVISCTKAIFTILLAASVTTNGFQYRSCLADHTAQL
jgi:hypothetical protein